MQYRTYNFKELEESEYYNWSLTDEDGTVHTYINKDTLVYATSGAVAEYSIDNDYMVSNNSTVGLAAPTKAIAGQIIALIEDDRTEDVGVITSVDNANYKIYYKSILELFNKNILNPARNADTDSGYKYYYDGVQDTANILGYYFASSGVDKYCRMPIRCRTSGGGSHPVPTTKKGSLKVSPKKYNTTKEVEGLTWYGYSSSFTADGDVISVTSTPSSALFRIEVDTSISGSIVSYTIWRPVPLFSTVSVTFDYTYSVLAGQDVATELNVGAIWENFDNELNVKSWLLSLFEEYNVVVQCSLVFETDKAYIDVLIRHNTTGGRLLKNNIHSASFEHQEDKSAAATVCIVVDKEDKSYLSTWYLLSDNSVTDNASAANRVLPYSLKVAEFDTDNDDGATEQSVAESALLYQDYNHYISVKINRESEMYPERLNIGDSVKLVPEIFENDKSDDASGYDSADIIESIYTGRKESSENNEVTLIFGKMRLNYTDLIQIKEQRQVRR